MSSEVVLSLNAFYAIVIDWSSTTLLARVHVRLLRSGAYVTIIVAKMLVALLLAVITVLARPLLCATLDARTCALVFGALLVGAALDPAWVFVGRKQVWVPQALSASRFFAATLLSLLGINPLVALALAFPATSLALSFALRREIRMPSRFSWGICQRIIRRHHVPTLTELLTAGFTRLDVAAAAYLLPADKALVYAVSRKLVLGLLSVAFASTRLLYLERDREKAVQVRSALKLAMLGALCFGGCAAYVVAVRVFGVPSGWGLAATLAILLLLLPLGYLKNRIQYAYLFREQRFASDLALNLGAALMYCCVGALAFAWREPASMSLARVSADAFYVSTALMMFGRGALAE